MSSTGDSGRDRPPGGEASSGVRGLRWGRIAGAAAGGILALLALLILPLWYLALPWTIQKYLPRGVVASAFVVLWARPRRLAGLRIPPETWGALDVAAGRFLGVWLPRVIVAACLILLAGWVPHYLTWPMWADFDQFAVSAQAWDAGILPYRDLPDFDFPGPIYAAWLNGKLFGWGHTASLYAVDVACLAGLGLAARWWSRRIFQRTLPGLIGYLVFLHSYLQLDYLKAAQRDWKASLGAALALMALEARPGRAGRVASALAFGLALAYRPQVVVFLPALISAIDEGARRPGEPRWNSVRALAEWSIALGLAVLLVFAPLLLAGVADDFVRVLGVARYGGSYNRVTLPTFGRNLLRQALTPSVAAVVVAGLLLMLCGPGGVRRPARTWCLALLGALVYKPMSPVQHDYLDLPLNLIWSIDLGVLVGGLLTARGLTAPVRASTVVLLLVSTVASLPERVRFDASLGAVEQLVLGRRAEYEPPGCEGHFSHYGQRYRWRDYQAVLDYLRSQTRETTRVANVLRTYPFPTLNGPTGRLSPFPAANGILYLWWVDPCLEDEFVRALERTPDSVVVWVPDEEPLVARLRLDRLTATIRRHYRPAARFGLIEVWRRAD
jgi:hypothetical protein